MTVPCTESHRLERIEKKQDRILSILEGNGANGVVTKVALNRQSISRMWWWVGGISLAIIGVAFFVIRSSLV